MSPLLELESGSLQLATVENQDSEIVVAPVVRVSVSVRVKVTAACYRRESRL